ncbi:MAG: sulfotransferase family 2 domain-containing protein [Cyanobacteria bacterium J06592_8]
MNELSRSDALIDAQIEIVSIHVPKTAGTTFRKILEQVYKPECILLDYPGEKRKRIQKEFQRRKDKIKVIHGHFGANKYRHYISAKRIIWIRDPIHRLLSHYFFWKNMPVEKMNHPEHRFFVENNLSIIEFASLSSIQNFTLKFMNNLRIEDFYFVGVQEFFQEDIAELKTYLNWADFEVEYVNTNPAPAYQELLSEVLTNSSIIDRITQLNSEDIKLYQNALIFREKRRHEYNIYCNNSSEIKLQRMKAAIEEYKFRLHQIKVEIQQ